MSARESRLPKRLISLVSIAGLTTALLAVAGNSPAFAVGTPISTVAGDGTPGYSGDGGPATSAQLNLPYGMATDGAGNVYVGDAQNNVIRKITPAGVITTVAGNGTNGYTGDGGPATAAEIGGSISQQLGVTANAAGDLWIPDADNAVVRKVDHLTGNISTVAGNGTAGYSGDGGPATAAQVNNVNDVLLAGSSFYVSDYRNHDVRKVDGSGIITTFAGNGDSFTQGDGGPATAAGVPNPVGIAADASGNVYIEQTSGGANSFIRKVDTSGTITTFAGTGSSFPSGDGGPATSAGLGIMLYIRFDSAGRLLFDEVRSGTIRRIDTSGNIHTIAGSGTSGYSGDGGNACFAQLRDPTAMTFDAAGNLLVSDYSNNVVRKIAAPIPDCISPARGLTTDFDSDFRADVSVYRPSGGTWFDHPSSEGGDTAVNFGASGDLPVPSDYDGDYTTDQAIYRPSTGLWAIHDSSVGDTFATFGGAAGDLPVPGDYDGDGKVDLAIYRPSIGFWYVERSSNGSDHAVILGGVSGDLPVPGDYDGDGRTDFAIFRPSTGAWFVHPSGADQQDYAVSYGASGDIPLPGDYDGDGRTDIAIFRPTTGLWAIRYSGGGADTFVTYGGIPGDIPVPGDYDGDQKADIAIFRPAYGAWFVHQSTNGADAITTFGVGTDIPLQLAPAVRKTFFP